ncbi:MAG: T9SS type A sorting domain-containing protein [Bacteroidetes bacterium]|nr:T9SS type A sorting domain-containing protein [Bacteroidota bacterium]
MKSKLLSVFLLAALPATAQFANYPTAEVVLGQVDFAGKVTATTQTGLKNPGFVAIDPVSGKLFVVDRGNHRILRYASANSLTTGAAAEGVLGQADFVTGTSGLTDAKMNNPVGIFINASGTMWVGDYGNNRVLRFDSVSSKADGAPADGVLGQTDFVTSATSATQAKTGGATGVWEDASGNLYVVCFAQHRVLRFDDAKNKANGANADAVLGQTSFTISTANTGGRSASTLSSPNACFVDGNGNLWVADNGNLRVLKYENPLLKANGGAADVVLGQPNFASASAMVTQNGFSTLRAVAGDDMDNLFVVLENTARVLVFKDASTLGDYANADYVIGQPDFTSSSAPATPTAQSLNFPRGAWVDNVNRKFWLADYNNSRVLKYNLEQPLPVELASFTALETNGSVLVKWETRSEINNAGFTLEKSVNRMYWTQVGSVSGKGNSSETQYYSLRDQITEGTVWYRLKQTDFDGSASYSQILEFSGNPDQFKILGAYPNPFNPETSIRFTLPAASEVTVKIRNIIGQELQVLQNGKMTAGEHSLRFTATSLASGIYFCTITANGKTLTKSLTLMK